ncbi:MAG: phosphatase PAP2 family protein [Lachnospiraceae bacterium]|nr:phosphatase PAP2 family protein [Lachnospiraceae bacterium]
MAWEFDFLHLMQDMHSPISDTIFKLITKLGDKGIFCILLAICLLLVFKDKRMGLTVCLAIVTEFIVCNLILKNIIARDRPFWTSPDLNIIIKEPTDYSFPSGHTSVWFALCTGVFCWNKRWGIIATVVAALVAFSRLYLTVHFPTDVLGGAFVGIIMAIISYRATKYIDKKYSLENRFGIL